MSTPLVTVIIPAYNGAKVIGEAVQSVLGQTYPDLELVVVDDASSDDTGQIVQQFDDPRVRYIRHQENRGADRARYTGLHASSGAIIALLDQDDYFHVDKLEAHVRYRDNHPTVGFTYNARYELDYDAKTIRELWRPPRAMSLADLALRYPLAPSDVVLSREWALQLDWLGSRRGAEILHFCNLYLSGCEFGFVERALNYRRYHSGRRIRDLRAACESELDNQKKVFADPRCPPELLTLRNAAHANLYMYWGYRALAQEETGIAREFLKNAVQLKPSIVAGMPCELMYCFLVNIVDDEKQNHAELLRGVLAQLPPELAHLSEQSEWAIAQGYLMKGARATIWGRTETGRRHFEQAAQMGARIDDFFLSGLTHQLLNYEAEFGQRAVNDVLQALAPYLQRLGHGTSARSLKGQYLLGLAYEQTQSGDRVNARRTAMNAIANNPKYLLNRGVLAILAGVHSGL